VQERERSETKVAEDYSWAITSGVAVMQRPIRFQCAGVQMDSLLYTQVVEHCLVSPEVCSAFRELNYCVCRQGDISV